MSATHTTAPSLGDDPDRLFTPAETAALLGIRSERTLRNWAAAGTGPKRLRIGGRHVRYRAADIREWLDTACAA